MMEYDSNLMSAEVCFSTHMVRSCEDVGPEFDGAIEQHDESIRPQVHLPAFLKRAVVPRSTVI